MISFEFDKIMHIICPFLGSNLGPTILQIRKINTFLSKTQCTQQAVMNAL